MVLKLLCINDSLLLLFTFEELQGFIVAVILGA